jgi:hypothetical protein
MQLSPTQTIVDKIISSLDAGGATQFSRLLYRSEKILNLLRNDQIKLIMAPVDAAFEEFTTLYNKSLELLVSTPSGHDILENHFTTMFTSARHVVTLPTINGQSLPIDEVAVARYKIISNTKVGDTHILFISIVIMTNTQTRNWSNQRSAGFKTALGNPGLQALLANGQIRGNNLIALCNTNYEMNQYCDRKDASGKTMFHNLLRQEFKLDLPANIDAREQYILSNNTFYTHFNYDETNGTSIKVSETRHIQALEFHNRIFCLDPYHALTVFRAGHDPQNGDQYIVTPLTATYAMVNGGPIDPPPKIKKLMRNEHNVFLQDYEGNVYNMLKNVYPVNIVQFQRISLSYTILDMGLDGTLIQEPGGNKLIIKNTGFEMASVPEDVKSLVNGGLFYLDIMDDGEYCTIINVESGNGFDFSDFKGSQYQCSSKKVFWENNTDKGLILTDSGELWVGTRFGIPRWNKIAMPNAAKVIDVSVVHVIGYDHRFISTALDDRGRIYHIHDNAAFNLLLTVPGLQKIFDFTVMEVVKGYGKMIQLNY